MFPPHQIFFAGVQQNKKKVTFAAPLTRPQTIAGNLQTRGICISNHCLIYQTTQQIVQINII